MISVQKSGSNFFLISA